MMTNVIVTRMQSWFTSRMPATKTRKSNRESIYDKAVRLIDDDRFQMQVPSAPPEFWVGTCLGDHGLYACFAVSQDYMDRHGLTGGRVGCTCEAGRRRRLCSHAIGAEELRTRGQQSWPSTK